jgi:hypothetical protein
MNGTAVLIVLCHFVEVARWSSVDTFGVGRLHEGLLGFTEDVFASLARVGWRERGECYLRD